ncbi:uncharacterized protein [Spinacia oleracea]|uniref:Uncharacterized protein n=1 Tax=Spinacia oleracea TaxID=3562 RepID=A0ABM3QHY1_SPIOL|nr:uncharacterized protein LOC130459547 [Spinacia oleracea]
MTKKSQIASTLVYYSSNLRGFCSGYQTCTKKNISGVRIDEDKVNWGRRRTSELGEKKTIWGKGDKFCFGVKLPSFHVTWSNLAEMSFVFRYSISFSPKITLLFILSFLLSQICVGLHISDMCKYFLLIYYVLWKKVEK